MSKKHISWFLFLLFPLLVVSCSEYNKLLKSTDNNLKLEKAIMYFEKKDYDRCLPLLEDLVASGVYRGTDKAEVVYYHYSYCHYHMGEFYLAAYYFKSFAKTFPASRYSEECLFMSAMCNVKNSPNWSLDQTETYDAMNEMQLFLNRYPESSRRDTCNKIMDQLRNKLETKAYENAYLYYKIENYKSASIAFKSMLEEFPDSKYRETSMFLIIKSDYLLAVNSIEEKKIERFEQTIKSYNNFVVLFPESTYLVEAESIRKDAEKQLVLLKKTN